MPLRYYGYEPLPPWQEVRVFSLTPLRYAAAAADAVYHDYAIFHAMRPPHYHATLFAA